MTHPISPTVETAQFIRPAASSEAQRGQALLTLAFSADPAVRWMYPDPAQFLAHFPPFVHAFGGQAFVAQTAQCAGDWLGAALWLAPGAEPDSAALGDLLESTISPRRRAEVVAVFEQMSRYHPPEPHWYLPLIGVDPAQQGRGIGSSLMQEALANCARNDLPAYLEATNPRNLRLYQRLGFKVLGQIRRGTSPTIFPMLWRAVAG